MSFSRKLKCQSHQIIKINYRTENTDQEYVTFRISYHNHQALVVIQEPIYHIQNPYIIEMYLFIEF